MTQSSCFADKSANNRNNNNNNEAAAAEANWNSLWNMSESWELFAFHTPHPQAPSPKKKACMKSELPKWIVKSGQSTLHTKHNMKHSSGLAQKYLKAKEKNYGDSNNISPCRNIIFKISSKRNQNPSRYCNSTTNLKFQHKPIFSLSKILI